MSEEMRCCICEADFRPSAMVGKKCKTCAGLYPTAKSKEDIKIVFKDKAKTLSDESVKEIVYAILEEANLKRVKCEQCDVLFFRNSPAQRTCRVCKEKSLNSENK